MAGKSIRTPIQIMGHGKLMRGTSEKSGKPYHFQEVSFGFTHPWMSGLRCDTDTLDGSDLIAVGCENGVSVGDVFDAFVTIDQYKNARIVGLISRA